MHLLLYKNRYITFLLMGCLFVFLGACGGGGGGGGNPSPAPTPDTVSDPLANSPQAHVCLQGSWLAVSQNKKNNDGKFNSPLLVTPVSTPEVNIIIANLSNDVVNADGSVDVYKGSDLRIWQYDTGFFQDTYSNDWSILLTSKAAGAVDGFFTTKNMCTNIYQASVRKDKLPGCDVNQFYDDESEIILDCTKTPATMTLHSDTYSINYQRVSDTADVLSPAVDIDETVVVVEPEPIFDDVLSGFDQATNAHASWAEATDQVLSGNLSLKSADISGSESATIIIDGEFLAGTLSFFYRVSSEESYDYFNFYLDNQLVITVSGTQDWSEFSQLLSQGYHSFKWEYKKDQSTSHGDDAAWIDQVKLPPVNLLPPTPLSLPIKAQNISASNNHYHAIRSDGTVWSWGYNYQGFMGDGTSHSDAVTVPVKVDLNGKAVAVNSYDGHVLALMDDGTVWAWGSNSKGQLGDGNDGENISGGSLFHNPTPVQVIGLSDIVQIATGTLHSVALSGDGRVWTWGGNSSGQLGIDSQVHKNIPVLVAGIDHVVDIAAGLFSTLMVRQNGTVWVSGSSSSGTNTYSTLGIEGVFQSMLPVQLPTLSNAIHIAHGGVHQFALKANDSVWAWGTNIYGRLGDGTTTNTTAAVEISTLTNIKSLSTHAATSMALSHDGEVWVWGDNNYQKLCTGIAGSHYSPVQLPISNVIEIAAGHSGYLLLTQAGELLACGSNSAGILGTGEPYNTVSSLKNVGYEFGTGIFNFNGDRDNDGVRDNVDAFPDDPSESVDTDGDGVGNNTDTDDDNDGVLDVNDAFPLDASEHADADNDSIGDNADTDDDNDGVNDNSDAYPFDPARQNPNSNPVLSGTPASNVNEDSLYSFTPAITDVDANETTDFTIENKPLWASFDVNTGSLSGTPSNNHVGIYSFIKITVTDVKGGSDEIVFSVTVNNSNDAPSISGSPNTQVNEDSAYSFTPTVTDVDVGDSHTFSIINKPSWASFNTATGELSGTPFNAHVTVYNSIQITATDSGNASDSLSFSITVNNTNDAPVISGTPATNVNEDSIYSFTPNVTDVDTADTKLFSITNKPAWASFNTSTGLLSGTPTVAHIGTTNNVVISVTDSASSSDSLPSFDLTVVSVNDAPVLNSATAIDVAENQIVTGYTASASDEENNTITYTISGGVDSARFSISAGALNFTSAPNFESPTDSGSNNTYVVNLTATDNGSPNLSDTLTLTVNILNVNEFAPVFSSSTITSRGENISNVGYTAIASDGDGDSVSFSISGGTDQSRFSVNSSNGTLSFTSSPNFEAPLDSNGDNIYVVNITATDNGAVSMSSTLTLTVTVLNVIEITSTGVGIKTVSLDWDSHADASYYKLFYYDQGTTTAPTQIGGNINTSQYEAPVHNHQWQWSNTYYAVEAYNSSNQEIPFSASSAFNITNKNGDTVGYFKASNSESSDQFGSVVAISGDGNTLVVGASTEKSNATTIDGDQTNNSLSNAGAAYVFVKSGSSWIQQAYLKANDTAAGNAFGYTVAISDDGDDIIVGAVTKQKAYIFTRSGTTWTQQASFQGTNITTSDQFGVSVSMSDDGNRVAVGASHQEVSVDSSGAVYVFDRNDTSWSETVSLKASNPDFNDAFGKSVALSGDGITLAVGAPSEDSNTTGINSTPNNSGSSSGAVYIFKYANSTWSQQAYIKTAAAGSTYLGGAISISDDGNVVAAGVREQFCSVTTVYVFNRINDDWFQQGIPLASNGWCGDGYGWELDLDGSGTLLAVSAVGEYSGSVNINGEEEDESAPGAGAVYYFKFSGSSWSQYTYIKATNTDADDKFGYAVSLSDDGNSLAVGAPREASNATGVSTGADTDMNNNTNATSGAVYLY